MTSKADAAIIAAYQRELTKADIAKLIANLRNGRKGQAITNSTR